MKNINLKEFLLGLNFFENKFLCEEEKKFLKYINIKNSKDVLMYLEVICKDYCNKNKTSKNYASYLTETIKRAYITEFLNINKYDEIILGFPIWWYVAPTIVNTFLEKFDFSGKKVVLFATSGGSGMGKTEAVLHVLCPDGVNWKSGKMLNGYDRAQMEAWVRTLA